MTVRIKLKRPNQKYPSCHLVGRDLTFPVNTTRFIPWVEFVFPTLRLAGYNTEPCGDSFFSEASQIYRICGLISDIIGYV